MAESFEECMFQLGSKRCRVCLYSIGEFPIFGDEKYPDISGEVTSFGNIELSKDDDLPKFLCQDCFKLLEAAVSFRKSAVQADAILKQNGKQEILTTEVSDSVKLETDTVSPHEFDDKHLLEHHFLLNLNEDKTLDVKNEVDDLDLNDGFDEDDNMVLMAISKNNIKTEQHKCKVCKMSFQSQEVLRLHKLTKSHKSSSNKKKKKVKSDVRNRNSSLQLPSKDHKCIFCNKLYSKDFYPIHMRNNHNLKVEFDPKTKQCPTCKKMFTPTYISRHIREMHAEDKKSRYLKPFKCELCNKHFTENSYTRHVRETHKIVPNIPTERKPCPICKKNFRPDYISRHMRTIHKGERPEKLKVECPICKKLFVQEYYQIHLKKHDKDRKDYVCDVCGKEFTFQSSFINHKLIHSNDLPFQCDLCPYKGRNKQLLRMHTRTHTGDYPYKCDQCNLKFINKSNLNRHMVKHRMPTNFQCDSCNKGFYTKLELERHITAIHLGIKSHICNICGAAFGYKHGMRKHQYKVHKLRGSVRRNAIYLKLQNESTILR